MAQSAVSPLQSIDFDAVEHPRPRSEGVTPQVASLHRDLMDTLDPTQRARVHVELGTIALKDGRLDAAARHFREALVLDPRSQAARRWLDQLAAERAPAPREKGLRGLLSRFKGG